MISVEMGKLGEGMRMSIAYCRHNNDSRFCSECKGLTPAGSTKIINMANHNIKKAHDDVTQRLIDAKNGKDNKSSVFVKDDIIYMHHQNTLISFTPEQAVALSEGLMTAGWTLIEDAKQQENEDGQSDGKEPGEPTEHEGESREGQGKEED